MDNLISFLSANCQGLNDCKKRRDVFHYLKLKKFDIYFLQDTHFETEMENYIEAEWGYRAYFSSFSSASRGVAILFNNSFEFKVKKVVKDCNGNYLLIMMEMNNDDFLLVNIYGPNKDEPEFYTSLLNKIVECNCSNVLMAGDWNLVLNPSKDYENYRNINNVKAQETVFSIIDALNMNDIWRDLNPESRRFTWRRSNPFQQSRLDFFLISDSVLALVSDADILCGYRTDHSYVTLRLQFAKNIEKRNTFWKFNTSLLRDLTYVKEINDEIDEVIEQYAALSYNREYLKQMSTNDIQFIIDYDLFLDFLFMKIC